MAEPRIPDPTLMARLQLSVKGVDWAASRVAPWQHEPFEGGWSAHQHLSHLLAVETGNYHVRIQRMLREDTPVLESWDNERAMAAAADRDVDIAVLAARFMAARQQTYDGFRELSVDQWRRRAVWPDGRLVDLAWVAEKVLWHALDHFATLLDIHQEFQPLQAGE